ncbi:MAG: hypothetical protein CL678_01650 [Bdellovibrionaceae bacterium]|nr:hypothetical protein [Pseudobdellovibrionaceae bacterium]|tara:strand:+ start:291 stop:779 length:489 start_codon:yes stop_codon:yes gene_type:complete
MSLEEFVKKSQFVIDHSIDPVAVLDTSGTIIYLNQPMKTFLGFRSKNRAIGLKIHEVFKLNDKTAEHRIKDSYTQGDSFKLHEIPATSGERKVRVSIHCAPIKENGEIVGGYTTLRDTSSEFLVQAKYHKVIHLNETQKIEIENLQDRVKKLQTTLRKAAYR